MNVIRLLDRILQLLGISAIIFLIGLLLIYIGFVSFVYAATWLWPDFYGSYSLGNNIYMLEWDGGKMIVNGTTIKGNTCYSGQPLIPTDKNQYDSIGNFAEFVVDAKSDDNWIIAKTSNHINNQRKYYIINKKYNPNEMTVEDIISTQIECFRDSSVFAAKCISNGVDIKW